MDSISFGVPRDIGEIFDFPSPRRSTADLVEFIFFLSALNDATLMVKKL